MLAVYDLLTCEEDDKNYYNIIKNEIEKRKRNGIKKPISQPSNVDDNTDKSVSDKSDSEKSESEESSVKSESEKSSEKSDSENEEDN